MNRKILIFDDCLGNKSDYLNIIITHMRHNMPALIFTKQDKQLLNFDEEPFNKIWKRYECLGFTKEQLTDIICSTYYSPH